MDANAAVVRLDLVKGLPSIGAEAHDRPSLQRRRINHLSPKRNQGISLVLLLIAQKIGESELHQLTDAINRQIGGRITLQRPMIVRVMTLARKDGG